MYAVDSSDPKYDNATYTIDEETDPGDFEGWFGIFIDYDDGSTEAIASFDADGLTDDGCLDLVDRQIAAGGHPPRGEVVIAP